MPNEKKKGVEERGESLIVVPFIAITMQGITQ